MIDKTVDSLVLGTALLEWLNEQAARAYITPDSAVSYLNHARVVSTDYTVVCFMKHDCNQKSRKVKTVPVQAECVV